MQTGPALAQAALEFARCLGQPCHPTSPHPVLAEPWLPPTHVPAPPPFLPRSGQRVHLVATAALSNVALLLMLYPEARGMVEVVIMGGCLGVGNTGARAGCPASVKHPASAWATQVPAYGALVEWCVFWPGWGAAWPPATPLLLSMLPSLRGLLRHRTCHPAL